MALILVAVSFQSTARDALTNCREAERTFGSKRRGCLSDEEQQNQRGEDTRRHWIAAEMFSVSSRVGLFNIVTKPIILLLLSSKFSIRIGRLRLFPRELYQP